MSIVVSHDSALEYWRLQRLPPYTIKGALRRRVPPAALSKLKLPFDNELAGLAKPVHLLISDKKANKLSSWIRTHFCRGPFPLGCFNESSLDVLVSSPEFCFLQMANKLTLMTLIQLGFEFCGSYSLPAHQESTALRLMELQEKGFVNCEPITSINKLSNFVAKMQGLHGHKRAKKALKYIADNSASPMETNLTILLTLPYRLGGYGFPMPLLNHQVEGSTIPYRCDLFWPKAKLAVEYDSDQFHTGADRIAKDSMRRNALALLGIKVVAVTWQQVRSTVKLREIATLLGKSLGKRLQFNDPEFTNRQLALRTQLF